MKSVVAANLAVAVFNLFITSIIIAGISLKIVSPLVGVVPFAFGLVLADIVLWIVCFWVSKVL